MTNIKVFYKYFLWFTVQVLYTDMEGCVIVAPIIAALTGSTKRGPRILCIVTFLFMSWIWFSKSYLD